MSSKHHLKRHVETHYKQHSHKCGDCGIFFKNKQLLENHNLLIHDDDCTNERLLQEESQESRNDEEETTEDFVTTEDPEDSADPIKEKRFACHSCDKKFHSGNHLRRHQDVHEGVKYGCKFCDSQFSRKDKANKHMREKHPEQVNAEKSEAEETMDLGELRGDDATAEIDQDTDKDTGDEGNLHEPDIVIDENQKQAGECEEMEIPDEIEITDEITDEEHPLEPTSLNQLKMNLNMMMGE